MTSTAWQAYLAAHETYFENPTAENWGLLVAAKDVYLSPVAKENNEN